MPKTFADLGVPEDLVKSLAQRGILEAFPIQEATLADSLDGLDVCGRAPTGSGKTLAFSIPLVDALERSRPKSPRGLVLVPTRELAAQVQETVEPLAKARGLRSTAVYGGVGFDTQLKAFNRGVDIVVATPGRLKDLIERGALTLRDVEFVVIDEADRMADMGFLPEVKKLLDQTNEDRQTLLFSATLDGDVKVLIDRYQYEPVMHEVIRDEDEEDLSLHLFWKSKREDRLSLVTEALKRVGSTVVFVRTKHGADRLAQQLGRAGVAAAAIHGDRSQGQRERALAAFTNGKVQALVATDVAARGIHVDDVECVIHYDIPEDHKTYVHRSGRTARAGASGTVISLVQPDQVRALTQMQRQLEMAAGVMDPNFKALPDMPATARKWEGEQAQPEVRTDGDGGGRGGRNRRPRSGGGGNGGGRGRRRSAA